MSDLWKAESQYHDFNCWPAETGESYTPPAHYLPDSSECQNCGVCLSSCSSYYLEPIYEESPRGRVALLRQTQLGQTNWDAESLSHLNNCLQCRSCETVCPSQMDYQYWYDETQQQLHSHQPIKRLARLGFWLITHKRWRKALLPAIALFQHSGLIHVLEQTSLLQKVGLDSISRYPVHPSLSEFATIYPVKKIRLRGRVALFTGCLAEHFDQETLRASIKVLNHIGYEVVVPHEQTCCGALHQHHGLSAQSFMAQNIRTFYELEITAVIFAASACGAMLKEYPDQDSEMGGWFHRHLFDIHDFLLSHWPDNLTLAASNLRVAVHEPCSQRHVLKNSMSIHQLLAKIPELTLELFADSHLCCGAGGSYMLRHPEKADQLRELKWEQVARLQPDLVVSTNFGCALHLNSGQQKGGLKFVHPIRLLADRL